MTDEITQRDLFRHLASRDFKARCREVWREIERGADIPVPEIARRLNIPEAFLMSAAAAWLATETGKSILMVPAERVVPPGERRQPN